MVIGHQIIVQKKFNSFPSNVVILIHEWLPLSQNHPLKKVLFHWMRIAPRSRWYGARRVVYLCYTEASSLPFSYLFHPFFPHPYQPSSHFPSRAFMWAKWSDEYSWNAPSSLLLLLLLLSSVSASIAQSKSTQILLPLCHSSCKNIWSAKLAPE